MSFCVHMCIENKNLKVLRIVSVGINVHVQTAENIKL
jgi:hypothetical protein